nr:hypothetical protein [Bacillus thuringiensis]
MDKLLKLESLSFLFNLLTNSHLSDKVAVSVLIYYSRLNGPFGAISSKLVPSGSRK